jgi:hypothetical protein
MYCGRMAMHGLALVFGALVAHGAAAVPLAFNATLTLQIGTLPTVVGVGSGVAQVDLTSGRFTLPAGVMSFGATTPLSPPWLNVIYGAAVGAPGQGGKVGPYPSGSNLALDWISFGSPQMGLQASLYLLAKNGKAVAGIPLTAIGRAITMWPTPLEQSATIFANPYQLGVVTVSGSILTDAHTIFGTGFDARDAARLGVLQLTSPNLIEITGLGSLAVVSTLTLTFVPEPGTALLLGAGLCALTALRSPRR